MATRKAKNEDERLDSDNLDKVISLLEPKDGSKPITKKEACELLNITYNTTRLGKLIEAHKERKAREAQQRASKRGKPPTKEEIQYTISTYLEGVAVTNIANAIYRTPDFVNKILEFYNVPRRAKAHDYFNPEPIPDGAVRTRFKEGEKVYSARYDSLAIVEAEDSGKDEWVYRIWLLSDKWHQYAYQPASELASLEHLIELGVQL